jgi:nitroreductase
MKVSEAVLARRSVRAFTPEPINNETIKDLLALAARSPSGGNLQPWKIYVINNESMKKFAKFQANWDQPEVPGYEIYPSPLKEPYRTSRYQLGEAMYELLGISRDNKEAWECSCKLSCC